MLDERGSIAPFGWMIACVGRGPGELRNELQQLEEWSARTWARHFPVERGYRIVIDRADRDGGLSMSVERGDFRAKVSLEHEPSTGRERGSSSTVRMFGEARSEALRQAHAVGERFVARGRALGFAGGIGLFVALAWLMIGVRDPVYVLGGMLLVVALLAMLTAGGTLGAWFGERMATLHRARIRRAVRADPALDHDVRRWKAVSRLLGAQRSALQSRRRQPFRDEPRVLAS